ncbi:MAG: fructose PTS transporter subunit IIA [Phycisphaerae bacterium]|nr:fructose PTS transporter subunit IIA [Phycisphaerae bacterium]
MLIIVMHNNRGYLDALSHIVESYGITDKTIIEHSNIGSQLIGNQAGVTFHRGQITNKYDKAFIAIIKDNEAQQLMDMMETDSVLTSRNSNDKGFICTLPFQKIKMLGAGAAHLLDSAFEPKFADLARIDRVMLNIKATDKNDAIKQMSLLFRTSEDISDWRKFSNDALEREALSPTAVGNEIAFPHARSTAVNNMVFAFARCKEGVDFGAMDSKPVKLIFLIGTPHGTQVNAYLKILAALNKAMLDETFKKSLLSTAEPSKAVDLIKSIDNRK